MKFRLPIRPMYRPPSKAYSSMADKRRDSQLWVNEIARELSEQDDVKKFWASGNEKALIAICKKAEWEAGEPTFVTTTMIYTALKGLLR